MSSTLMPPRVGGPGTDPDGTCFIVCVLVGAGLRSETGWVVARDQLGRELHPVWPHPKFADSAAVDEWAGSRPEPIEIHDWLDVWTPGILESGRLVVVFPSGGSDDVAIDPGQFAADLQEELDKIE